MNRQYFRRKKQSKYKARTCKCHQGHQHDSCAEAEYCDQLTWLVKDGSIQGYTVQVSFDLHDRSGKKVCAHIIDFLVTTVKGAQEVHEYKGFATKDWNLKRKLFEGEYTEIPYIVIT